MSVIESLPSGTEGYTKNPSDTNMGANEPRLCKTKALVKAFLVSSGR